MHYYYSNVYYRVFNLNTCILTKLDLFPASAHEIVPATVHGTILSVVPANVGAISFS